ncbi:hypothetical protein DY000_02042072 [Brassica cretica]|uniref:Uncharacterized protein n=1 Tax=Brassica cretica TaxID=69181 RepID=A0ABQ7BCY2_BRACR|nr:hypothetical protein DY000_02042072 [Brassica cretica]
MMTQILGPVLPHWSLKPPNLLTASMFFPEAEGGGGGGGMRFRNQRYCEYWFCYEHPWLWLASLLEHLQWGEPRGLQHSESTYPRHRKTNSKGPRGKDHAGSTTRSHELEESSRSDAGKATRVIPIFSYPRCRRLCSRSHAGEAARDHSPARTKNEYRRRSNAGRMTRVGADALS